MSRGTVKTLSGISLTKLEDLLNHSSFYYFLRWPHQVSGIVSRLLEDFPSPEGQAFNKDLEIRWKKQQTDSYAVLWLGTQDAPPEFQSIPGDWTYEDYDAQVYPETETRLPKGIKPIPKGLDIGQRYFRNSQTATIHFIALRVK